MKKAMSVLLALLLLCLAPVTVFAGSFNCDCANVPMIYLDGIGQELYLYEGTDKQVTAPVIGAKEIALSVASALPGLSRAVTQCDWDAAANGISSLLLGLTESIRCDNEGNSVHPVTRTTQLDTTQNHREDANYAFYYDWRLDPLVVADQLHAFIQQLSDATGHKKVALWSFSEGGVMLMAYLAKHGTDYLESFVVNGSAHGGLTLVGELFNRNVTVTAEAVYAYARAFLSDDGALGLVASVLDILQQSGILPTLANLIEQILANMKDAIFDQALIPAFAHYPALWAFVPDAYYESAKVSMFQENPAYDTLIERIDAYHYGVQTQTETLLRGAMADGVKVAIACSYGYSGIPATGAAQYHTDVLIDTARASSGATVAPFGTTFAETYRQANADGHTHISQDRVIDASTCILPEQTWFIKHNMHRVAAYVDLNNAIAAHDGQMTVHSDAKYPQFLDYSTGELLPLEAQALPHIPQSLPEAVTDLFAKLLRLLVQAIQSLAAV